MLLAINTCLRHVEIALIDTESNTVIKEFSEESERNHTEKVFEFISKALELGPSDSPNGIQSQTLTPDKVLVVTGPGAFTSIRVGVVTANTIAFAASAKGVKSELYAIDLVTLFKQEDSANALNKPMTTLPIFLSAGKSEIYELKSLDNFVKNDADKFFEEISSEFYGDLSETHKLLLKYPNLLKKRKLTFGEAVLQMIKNGTLETHKVKPDEKGIAQVLPTYLKEPNISISTKGI
ncbi:MAG: hypothetical protein Q8P68_01645 [Candidatus Peregrinibacteria bacterium]|nr:hypothetical protein [Candidatus Peregrinibacteria bacterium]MDZ4244565.1 hypothetical protein [Candidatus Gracilibacteria bacterium]